MQLTHVSTNLGQGLRRNASMHAAVVLTLFVSLSLAGLGVLFNKEAGVINDRIGDQLTLTVYLCVDDDPNPANCAAGRVTDEQRQTILSTISANPENSGEPRYVSEQEAYDKARALVGSDAAFEGKNPAVQVGDLPSSYVVTLQDPKRSDGIESEVEGLAGVEKVESAARLVGPIFGTIDILKYGSWGVAILLLVAAVMLVANTIRLAALARRKEIEIMRMVGASRVFIALPFLLEALVSAVIGVALTAGALAAFTYWGVIRGLAEYTSAIPFIGWNAYWWSMLVVAIAGPLITVLPTLLLTRKYLRA